MDQLKLCRVRVLCDLYHVFLYNTEWFFCYNVDILSTDSMLSWARVFVQHS